MTCEIEGKQLRHYQRPFLRVERIGAQSDAGRLVLHHGDRKLVLTVEGGDFDAAYQFLEELRNPDSACWTQVRERSDEGLLSLVDRLDRVGWLGEAESGGRMTTSREADGIRGLMHHGREWLIEAAACSEFGKTADLGCSYPDILLGFAQRSAARESLTAPSSLSSVPTPSANGEIDLAGEALCLMFRRWRRTSPLALRIVHNLFTSAHGCLVSTQQDLSSDLQDLSSDLHNSKLTMVDPEEVGNQVWTAMVLLVLSASGQYRSNYREFVPTGDLAGPGLNVLGAAEMAAERLMLNRGASPLLHLLNRGTAVRRSIISIHLHQYFITMRNIEVLYTLLENRLRRDLKKACTQYLLEEIGHEVHELDACRELGVQDEEVAQFTPLPFFAAYPEVLGAIAEMDPLACCLAISVAEGLPGAGKPLVSSLTQRGISGPVLGYHQSIDERLDHELATRRLMQNIPWVATEAARRSIRRFLYAVELSQVGWHQVANYAEAEMLPTVPVIFGMSAQQVLSTFVILKDGVGGIAGAAGLVVRR
jgi:hypothetical protein